jgi:hypothetical protein
MISERKTIVKLELVGQTDNKLNKVSKDLYNLNLPSIQAIDNNDWTITDDVLYSTAKKSYDEIIHVFDEKPLLYKFESIKEKVWEGNRKLLSEKNSINNSSFKQQTKAKQKAKDKKKKQIIDSLLPLESNPAKPIDIVDTYIDPFQFSNDWVKLKPDENGIVEFNNKKTGEITIEPPDVILFDLKI